MWQPGDNDADHGHVPGVVIDHRHLDRGDDDAVESRGHIFAGTDKQHASGARDVRMR
ncbi:hypothetical protein I0Q12_24675 [Rhodococcus sp. CX]|uniref:hypothetical protein n=1 Tax=Rhodococcus sp. CX TaxID=2789880 RepID=UPI0018CF77A4|nr:hypothetical protein [Rhodococcus sp. CX]MBH0122518.1 hypothetical protein [Rhodococcus sp. CX]